MKVSDLSKDRKDLVVDLGDGDVVNIVYNPKAYTIEIEEQVEAAAATEYQAKALGLMLANAKSPMLLDWDICQEEPGDFPVTPENIKVVPVEILGKIIEAIGEDARPSSAEGKS